jgi:hypothetical protein
MNNELGLLNIPFVPDDWISWDKTVLDMDSYGNDFATLRIAPTTPGQYLVRIHGETTDVGVISEESLLTPLDGNRRLESFLVINVAVPEPSTLWLVCLGASTIIVRRKAIASKARSVVDRLTLNR